MFFFTFENEAQTIANYIIEYCVDNNLSLKGIRLQKLLYAIQGLSFKRLDQEAFKNDIEAWDYGPVVADIYYSYGYKGSSEFTKDDIIREKYEFKSDVDSNKYSYSIVPAYNEEISSELQEIITDVINVFSTKNDFYLVEWSHKHDSWKKVYDPSNIHNIITKESIRKQFTHE